jgi:hypothetical protein
MAGDKLTFHTARSASDHKGTVSITRIEHAASGFLAFGYQCSLEEDLDGAPRAYGLNNPHPVDQDHNPHTIWQTDIKMLETYLSNAADPVANFVAGNHLFHWVGLFSATQAIATANGFSIDRRPFLEARARRLGPPHYELVPLKPGEAGFFPVIQNFDGDAPGYYVSTTSAITDPAFQEWDQRRYVNAVAVPYAAHAGWWRALGVELGDFGLAIRPNTGAFSGFVFGDTGTGRVGEVSRKLFETLTPERNNEDLFLFLVFPKSGVGVANKFDQDVGPKVIQDQVKRNVRKLNVIPGNDALVDFLALHANADKLRLARYGEGDDDSISEGDPRWWNILGALRAFEYSSND